MGDADVVVKHVIYYLIDENDTYPIHVHDNINMTVQYIVDNPSENNTSHAALLQTKI